METIAAVLQFGCLSCHPNDSVFSLFLIFPAMGIAICVWFGCDSRKWTKTD